MATSAVALPTLGPASRLAIVLECRHDAMTMMRSSATLRTYREMADFVCGVDEGSMDAMATLGDASTYWLRVHPGNLPPRNPSSPGVIDCPRSVALSVCPATVPVAVRSLLTDTVLGRGTSPFKIISQEVVRRGYAQV